MATYNAPYDRTTWRNMVLSQSQMQENAIYIYDYMATKYNWTLNAVAGMLGNLESESTMNPARPQNNAVKNQWWDSAPGRTGTAPHPTTTWYGFGLFQVTPWYAGPGTKRYNPHTLGNWAISKGYTASYADGGTICGMDVQLDWLIEGAAVHFNNPDDNNRDQAKWYQDSRADFNAPTPTDYGRSTQSPESCARTFYWNLERSGALDPGSRPTLARKWYTYLKEHAPTPPTPPTPTPTGHTRNFIIIAKASGLF